MGVLPALSLICANGIVRTIDTIAKKSLQTSFIVVVISLFSWNVYSVVDSSPYYLFYVNEIGGGDEKEGYYYPYDTYYDIGAKEASKYINNVTQEGDVVAAWSKETLQYYVSDDITVVRIPESYDELLAKNVTYVVVQKESTQASYLGPIEYIEDNYELVKTIEIDGKETIKIYKIE